MKFRVKKKNEIGSHIYQVYEILPMQNQFGSVSAMFFMYDETDKKFMSDECTGYEIIPEIKL